MTDNTGATESTTGGEKYDTLPAKPDDLRELVAKWLCDNFNQHGEGYWDRFYEGPEKDSMREDAKQLLDLLAPHRVVRLAEDQTKPYAHNREYRNGQIDMHLAGFRRVRSLTEERQ